MSDQAAGATGSARVGPALSIRELSPEELAASAPRLIRLQHDAYAVEARLIGDDRIPPLHETEGDLRSAGLRWLAAFERSEIIAALGFAIEDDELDLDRLVVAPEHHRRGIGVRLVAHALPFASRVTVSTGRANLPARALYERLGFVHEEDAEVIPGLWVSTYGRKRRE